MSEAKAAGTPPEYTVHDHVYPPRQAIGPAWDGTTQNGKWWVKVGNGFYGHLNALGDVQHDCCWFDTREEAKQAIAVYRERRQQATDATHSELEQLRERNDFLATMLAGADATMFELEQVIPRNESDRDYSETVTKAFESLRERVRELEAENRSEQMRHTGGMLSMVFDEQSLTADLTTANQRIAELELLLKGANATLGELEQVIPRNESDRDYCETVANRIAELEAEQNAWNVDSLTAKVREQKDEICQLHDIRSRLTTQLTAANEKCERLEQANTELRHFIHDACLHMQLFRSTTDDQKTEMFQRSYRLYMKHNCEEFEKP